MICIQHIIAEEEQGEEKNEMVEDLSQDLLGFACLSLKAFAF